MELHETTPATRFKSAVRDALQDLESESYTASEAINIATEVLEEVSTELENKMIAAVDDGGFDLDEDDEDCDDDDDFDEFDEDFEDDEDDDDGYYDEDFDDEGEDGPY